MRDIFYLGKEGRRFWVKKIIFIPFLVAAGLFVFGNLVMYLWNAILPEVMPVHTITFWQALGIFLLSKILFGGYHGGDHRHHAHDDRRKELREQWMKMNPEEREKMRSRVWGRFDHCDKKEE
jgi:hypothetical protein